MLGKLALVFGVSYLVIMGMASIANSAELNDDHISCIDLSLKGFNDPAVWEQCKINYPGIPSPLRFRCVEALDKGFPSEGHVKICVMYFGTKNTNRWARQA